MQAHFRVFGVKGVRGTRNRNHEVVKSKNSLSGKGCGHAGWSRGVEVHAQFLFTQAQLLKRTYDYM
jgi:hypothetical protein